MTHEQLALMFEVMLYGGLRISEVLQITPSTLIGGGKIKLSETKGGRVRCDCSKWKFRPIELVYSDKNCKKCHGLGKYRVDQTAWIDNQSVYMELEMLAQGKEPEQKLFPISRTTAWIYADKLGARTHTLRNTFITWMLETGKFDIRDIKQKARHTSLATTDRYIQTNPDLTQQKAKGVFERV